MESGIEVGFSLEETSAPSPTSTIDIAASSSEEDQEISSRENDKIDVPKAKKMLRKHSLVSRSRYNSRKVSVHHAKALHQTLTKTSPREKKESLVTTRWFPISAFKSKLHLRISSLKQLRQQNFQLKKKIANKAPSRYPYATKIKKNGSDAHFSSHSNKRRKESISKSALPFVELESTDDDDFGVSTTSYNCPYSPVLGKRKSKSTAMEQEEAARSFSPIKEDEDDPDGFVLALSLSEEEEESRDAPTTSSIDDNNNQIQDVELPKQLESALDPMPQDRFSIPKREECWYYLSDGKRRKYWLCDWCDYKTITPISLASHISKKHPFSTVAHPSARTNEEPNLFQCAHCEFSTQEKYRLERHEEYHQKETDHSCKFCSFSADSLGQLGFHVKNHHSNMKKDELFKTAKKSRLYKCPECDFSTTIECTFALHEAKHKRNAEFKCSLCSYSSKHKVGVTRHSNHFHGNSPAGLAKNIEKKAHQSKKIGLRSTPMVLEIPLQQISMIENNRKLKHQCSLCSYSTNDVNLLNLHKSRHEKIATHKCPCCSYSSDFKNSLTSHLRRQHPDHPESVPLKQTSLVENNWKRKHQCSLCSYSTNDFNYMKFHQRRHKKKAAHKCPCCSFSSDFKNTLTWHLRRQHPDSPQSAPSLLHKCLQCSYSTDDFTKMKIHHSRHEKIAEHKCEYCSYSSDLKRVLTMHLRRYHPESAAKTGFECQSCDFKATDRFHMKAHEVRHQRNLKFKCPRCNYSSNSKPSVTRHLINHHREEKSLGISKKTSHSKISQNCIFKCNECLYSTDKDNKMNRHLLAHKGKGKYKCPRCTFSTDSQSGIYSHRNRHHPQEEILADNKKDGKMIKKGKIQPGVENAKKKTVPNVTKARVSNGQHIYECEVCTFSTSQAFHFEIHKKGHQEKGKNKCHICNFSTNFKKSITRHLRYHHLNVQRDVDSDEEIPSSSSPSHIDISRNVERECRPCRVVLQDISLNPLFPEGLLNCPKVSKRKGDEIVAPSPKKCKQTALKELEEEEAKCLQQILEIEEDINCDQLKMEKIQKKLKKEEEKKTNLEDKIRSLRNKIDVMLENVRKADQELKEVSSKMNYVREKINQVTAQKEAFKCDTVDVSIFTPDDEMEIGQTEEVESTAEKIKFLEDALGSLREQENNCLEDFKIAEESFVGANQVVQTMQVELEGLEASLKEDSLDKSFQKQMDELIISSDEKNKRYFQLENNLLEIRERKRAEENPIILES